MRGKYDGLGWLELQSPFYKDAPLTKEQMKAKQRESGPSESKRKQLRKKRR